jgi:hypothetical protein
MNIDGPDLEDRYRRVLRLLPRYYRAIWEEDMVAALLDSRMTGDEDEDEYILEFGRPAWPEVASVVALAARLYLGGAGAPRRYLAWGQAVRGAVLALLLTHAIWGLSAILLVARSHRLLGWLPPTPAAGGIWLTVWYTGSYSWIVVFVALVLRRYGVARAFAGLAVTAALAIVLQGQLAGELLSPFASWSYLVLMDFIPVAAMAAFHQDAPPVPRRAWLLALPAGYLLVNGPWLTLQLTGNSAWLPDDFGLCCLLVALACLAHAPRAWSSQADTGSWSLTLTLLAGIVGLERLTSLSFYPNDPHLARVGLAELLIMVAAAALVAPDAVRAPAAMPAPPSRPRLQ